MYTMLVMTRDGRKNAVSLVWQTICCSFCSDLNKAWEIRPLPGMNPVFWKHQDCNVHDLTTFVVNMSPQIHHCKQNSMLPDANRPGAQRTATVLSWRKHACFTDHNSEGENTLSQWKNSVLVGCTVGDDDGHTLPVADARNTWEPAARNLA